MIEQLLTITNSVGNSHRSVGLRPWRRTENFLLIFLQFYVYDLRFKAWGPTTFWLSFKHWLLRQNKATQDCHYSNVIMGDMASQITSISTVCSVVCSGAHQRKHQSSVSLAFVMGIHRWPVDSPHKGPVMRKMFPFDDAIICIFYMGCTAHERKLHQWYQCLWSEKQLVPLIFLITLYIIKPLPFQLHPGHDLMSIYGFNFNVLWDHDVMSTWSMQEQLQSKQLFISPWYMLNIVCNSL